MGTSDRKSVEKALIPNRTLQGVFLKEGTDLKIRSLYHYVVVVF
jgi:hypothetical protein